MRASELVVGVDPGLEGGIVAALVRPGDPGEPGAWDGLVDVMDMPVTQGIDDGNLPDARRLHAELVRLKPALIILERVHARERGPNRSIRSEWRFAQGFGSTLAACQLATDGLGVHLVVPSVWKAAMGLNGAGKGGSVDAAVALEPDLPGIASAIIYKARNGHLKRHDGRAEAALLVDYYWRHLAPLAAIVAC